MLCFTKKCRAIKRLTHQKNLLDHPKVYKNNQWVGETIYLMTKYLGDSDFPQQLRDIKISEVSIGNYSPKQQLQDKHNQAKRIIDSAISMIRKEGVKSESKFNLFIENIDVFAWTILFGFIIGNTWHPLETYWTKFLDWLKTIFL